MLHDDADPAHALARIAQLPALSQNVRLRFDAPIPSLLRSFIGGAPDGWVDPTS